MWMARQMCVAMSACEFFVVFFITNFQQMYDVSGSIEFFSFLHMKRAPNRTRQQCKAALAPGEFRARQYPCSIFT